MAVLITLFPFVFPLFAVQVFAISKESDTTVITAVTFDTLLAAEA